MRRVPAKHQKPRFAFPFLSMDKVDGLIGHAGRLIPCLSDPFTCLLIKGNAVIVFVRISPCGPVFKAKAIGPFWYESTFAMVQMPFTDIAGTIPVTLKCLA